MSKDAVQNRGKISKACIYVPKSLPMKCFYYEQVMQMLHIEMQCTCYQLALGLVCWVAPLHHIHVWQLSDLPIESH